MKIQTRKEIRLGKGHLISELKELDNEKWVVVEDIIRFCKKNWTLRGQELLQKELGENYFR